MGGNDATLREPRMFDKWLCVVMRHMAPMCVRHSLLTQRTALENEMRFVGAVSGLAEEESLLYRERVYVLCVCKIV